MAQISETAGISSIAPSEHQAERPLSARLGGLGQGRRGETRREQSFLLRDRTRLHGRAQVGIR